MIPYKEWSEQFQVSVDALKLYYASLSSHITRVGEYGRLLGVPSRRLRWHDASKLTKHEFPYYANRFYGDMLCSDAFRKATLHHVQCNDHHPECWVVGGKIYPMNRDALMEMIADWQAASEQYTGSADLTKWLQTEMPKKVFHPDTKVMLLKELRDIGYDL